LARWCNAWETECTLLPFFLSRFGYSDGSGLFWFQTRAESLLAAFYRKQVQKIASTADAIMQKPYGDENDQNCQQNLDDCNARLHDDAGSWFAFYFATNQSEICRHHQNSSSRRTEPGSLCEITVKKPNGSASRHPNLAEKRADAGGTVNWQWQMVEDAQPGERLVIVRVIGRDNNEIRIEKKMKVVK